MTHDELLAGLSELPSIGQSIGALECAMRRCRSTDSPLWKEYDKRRTELLDRQCDIISAIRIELVSMVEIT